MTDPFAVIPVRPKKKCILHKCSTCADRQCRVRGKVVDWMHCSKWLPGGQAKENRKRL